MAFIPPPPGFSIVKAIDTLIDAKLAKLTCKLEKVENDNLEFKRTLKEHENDILELKRSLKEHDNELCKLRAQLHESDNWLVHGVCLIILKSYSVLTMRPDELIQHAKALDQIILRNLVDKTQAMLAHAFGLGSDSHANFMSQDWRRCVIDIDEGARLENVKSLLSTSTNPIMQQLAASAEVLNILTDRSPRIRSDGDRVVHEAWIDRTKYSDAIGRCKTIADRQALNLFLDLVVTYKWQ